jgi:Xaa-Pro aminopeptidase
MKRTSAVRRRNILLYAASTVDPNALYATRFWAPDPFIFVRTAGGKRVYVMSDLEIDRARRTSNAHRVLPLKRYTERASVRGRRPHPADVIAEVLRDLRIASVTVPANFPVEVADRLRKRRVRVTPVTAIFPQRVRKSEEEVRHVREAMRITEKGLGAAIEVLRRSKVRGGWVMHGKRRLTADHLRQVANEVIFSGGCVPAQTIVAPGRQGCDPHETGSGPIRAGAPVIIDIFPRSEKTGYFGDITRTVVKGRASEKVRRMYDAVLAGQRLGLRRIRAGVDGRDVHRAILDLFESRGFSTGMSGGRMQGFFHGTGHGLGLEIHEPPRIAPDGDVLEAGMVVTVEPGLYYHPHGGVRIEDTVLVTSQGIRNLTRFPKFLEID